MIIIEEHTMNIEAVKLLEKVFKLNKYCVVCGNKYFINEIYGEDGTTYEKICKNEVGKCLIANKVYGSIYVSVNTEEEYKLDINNRGVIK